MNTVTSIQFTDDGKAKFAGMGDFDLISPNGKHRIAIRYQGEPPHGDSYHLASIDVRPLPGFVWGCLFSFSSCSHYAVFSWMEKKFSRQTMVIDLEAKHYFVIPDYIYHAQIQWPSIRGVKGSASADLEYTFSGQEQWTPY